MEEIRSTKKMKKYLKTFLAHGFATLNLPEILSRFSRKIAILCYHRVIPDELRTHVLSSPWLVVSKDSFEKQMRHLREHYHPLPLKKLLWYYENGKDFPPRGVVVTFDDGWADNYFHAFPILKRYRIPATIFLTTDYIETEKVFWPERVSFFLSHIEKTDPGAIPDFAHSVFKSKSSISRRGKNMLDSFIEFLKDLSPPERSRLILDLAGKAPEIGKDYLKANRLMTWKQVLEMNEAGIDFGSHGATHRILTQLPLAEARNEIKRSKEVLEKKIRERIVAFAYPNGNYNDEILCILREEGFQIALTTERGLNHKKTNLFRLKRLCLDDITLSDFSGKFSEAVFSLYLSGALFNLANSTASGEL